MVPAPEQIRRVALWPATAEPGFRMKERMSHLRSSTALAIALAVGGLAGGCKQDRGKGELHAQVAAREREAEGMRASLARAERGEPVLSEDAVVVSVSEAVIKEFLDAQLPFAVEAGSFKVTLSQAEAIFKGSPAVNLTGAIAPAGHPGPRRRGARARGTGGHRGRSVERDAARDRRDRPRRPRQDGRAREVRVRSGWLDELARVVRKRLEGHVPEVPIPVKIEQGIELPSVTDGPVLIQGARMPLEVAVADIFAGGGLLWVAVKVVPGELVKTSAPIAEGESAKAAKAASPSPPAAEPKKGSAR